MPLSRRRIVPVVVVLALLLVGAGAWWWARQPGTRFAEAARLAPADTQRVTWTDWAGVRRELGARGGSADRLRDLLARGGERDLVTTSALGSSAEPMRSELGLSPLNLEWELLSQGPEGAAVFLRTPDGFAFDRLADRLAGLGYRRPSAGDGTWRGGIDVAASAGFSPQLQYVVLLEDQELVVVSDQATYASTAAETASGERDHVPGLQDVVDASGAALSAVAMTGDLVCEQLAMAQADPDDAEQGEALAARAGDVHPLAAFALAAGPGSEVTALFELANEAAAEHDAKARAELAGGAAPGQGGDFSERFTVHAASVEGSLVRLRLDRVEGAYVMGDLTSGPVLFAAC